MEHIKQTICPHCSYEHTVKVEVDLFKTHQKTTIKRCDKCRKEFVLKVKATYKKIVVMVTRIP